MRIIRLATPTLDQLDSRTDKLKDEVRDIKRDLKSDLREIRNDIKAINKTIDGLNIGQRRFWQSQTIFTSLQRKIERFEKIEAEWRNYKKTLEDDLKSIIEKRVKAQVKSIGNIGQG